MDLEYDDAAFASNSDASGCLGGHIGSKSESIIWTVHHRHNRRVVRTNRWNGRCGEGIVESHSYFLHS